VTYAQQVHLAQETIGERSAFARPDETDDGRRAIRIVAYGGDSAVDIAWDVAHALAGTDDPDDERVQEMLAGAAGVVILPGELEAVGVGGAERAASA
jgi:hypothetical protein